MYFEIGSQLMVTKDTIKKDVKARLTLSQQLLEESDKLQGYEGYDHDNEEWWLHPRHEREALVIYLLLTCFDRLGQDLKYISFNDWLQSNKQIYKNERDTTIDLLPPNLSPTEFSIKLFERYQDLYGVRNSFCQGIMKLSSEVGDRFLDSVKLVFCPDFGKEPNTSFPSFPLDDKKEEQTLKLRFLYKIRNRFTHNLYQYHCASAPATSIRFTDGSSWCVWIRKSKRIIYGGCHQEHEILATGGAYVYSITDWPFILFETLYAAIDLPFDRTTIDLSFLVQIESEDCSTLTSYNNVKHKYLKDFVSYISSNTL